MYLAVRLIKLEDFPIWFFADEAIQTILASDFVRQGLRDFHGYLFPTYFLNVYGYNENLTVYVQVIPYLLFGKSVFVTRATSVLVTAFGAVAVGLILRHIFRLRMPWTGILLLVGGAGVVPPLAYRLRDHPHGVVLRVVPVLLPALPDRFATRRLRRGRLCRGHLLHDRRWRDHHRRHRPAPSA